MLHSELGTQPRQVVDFARKRFLETKEFECVFAVFDRDDHTTYADALARARALDNTMRNDAKQLVRFFCGANCPLL